MMKRNIKSKWFTFVLILLSTVCMCSISLPGSMAYAASSVPSVETPAVSEAAVSSEEENCGTAEGKNTVSEAADGKSTVQEEIKTETTATETPEETTAETPKETSTEAPKETTTEAPKETSTGAPKETGTEAPKETTTEAPKETGTETPKETTTVASKVSKTTVTGLKTKYNISIKSSAEDTITVSPAYGRSVKLQRYDSSSKKWKTIKTYKTGSGKSADIKLSYASGYWSRYKYTKWRVYVPAVKNAASFTSKTVTIIPKNRESLTLSCKSALVMNAKNGNVYYDKSMNTRRPQASLTKIMTCMLAIENNSLKSKATISKNAAGTPWTYISLIKGDKIYVKDLLYAALLRSSNGCAVALAEHTGKSVSGFARIMNKKAQQLGCKNTHFVNPHGLDARNHYSSAYDVGLITSYAWKNKTFRSIIKTKRYSFKTLVKKKSCTVSTTNQLLGKVTGMQGGKTGTTSGAGNCFAGVYTYKDNDYIIVVLGSKTDSGRWSDARKLISYAKKYGW
ncbi:MAG: hypothetical protein SO101_03720 [Lachnospiraceae bacterium]|nr:hypothetical protein [Lachnospiraceae bacterium]